jgi:hypothetical protein
MFDYLPIYSEYLDSDYAGSGWLGVFYYLLRNSVFFLLVYFAYRKDNQREKQLIVAVFSLILMMTGLGFSVNLFIRASEYLLMIVVIELPNAFEDGKLKQKAILESLVCFVMLGYFLFALYIRPEWNYLYPYEFWK